jgi:RimJ/RimL family protein N-acetyltransferase
MTDIAVGSARPTVPSSERLVFRTWSEADEPLACALWGDAAVTRHLGAIDARARLAEEIACARAHGIQYWPLFSRDGAFVGCAGLHPHREEARELGYHLRPEFWGRGLAFEAARAVVEFAFGVLDLHTLVGMHGPDNHASKRVLEKLGFTYTHDELYPPTGRMHVAYGLLRR